MKNAIKKYSILGIILISLNVSLVSQNIGVSGAFNPSSIENCESSDLNINFSNEDFVSIISSGDAMISVTFPLTGEYMAPDDPPTESIPGTFNWTKTGNVWEGMLMADINPLSIVEITFTVVATNETTSTSSNLEVELLTGQDLNNVNNMASPSLQITPNLGSPIENCPATDQGTYSCIEDIPDPALTQSEFETLFGDMIFDPIYCEPFTITYFDDTSSMTSGCALDPTIITRSYVFESDNFIDTCEVQYFIADDNNPILSCVDVTVSIPENGTVIIDLELLSAGIIDPCTGENEEGVILSLSRSIFSCEDLNPNETSCLSVIMVTLYAEDACGNIDSCTANITLLDDSPPVLSCPSDVTLSIEGGECAATYLFDLPSAVDNCANSALFPNDVTVSQISGTSLTSGDSFEIGEYTWEYEAVDNCGNISTCEFSLEVVGITDVLTTLACNDLLNISLNQECSLEVNADMILEGGPYRCYDDYIIEIEGIIGTTITSTGLYTVTITDPETGNNCWSEINVEDKLPPVINCVIPLCDSEFLRGNIEDNENPFLPDPQCWDFGNGTPLNEVNYDIIELEILIAGNYTFTMTDDMDFDGIGAIYAGNFDPQDQCTNLIIGGDNLPGILDSEPEFTSALQPGTYTLVTSSWTDDFSHQYQWTYDGPESLLSDCIFKCFEYTSILEDESQIPDPQITDCSDFTLFYADSYEGDDCDGKTLTRTYVATDINGLSSSCIVSFEFLPAEIDLDVILPISFVELGCNEGTNPEEIAAFFDLPQTLDNPNTSFIENNEGFIYAYPTYIQNGHNQKVDNSLCNIYTTYTDNELPICGNSCTGNKKVIRTWTIVDWCNLELINHTQTISSVDKNAPTLTTQDISISTDYVLCTASFPVPEPLNFHDDCDPNPKYDISGPAGVSIIGSFETGFDVIQAPKGIHTFYYETYDCCGNQESYPFIVNILDQTPPVIVAKQDIVISLTNGTQGIDGYAKLFTNSVDNGSHDGCSPQLKFELRRDSDICGLQGNTTYNADGHSNDGSGNPQSPNYDSDDGLFVRFCCEDVNNASIDIDGDGMNDPGYVKVWIRAWDDGDMDGFFGSEGDNFNEAWVHVKVEDKLDPTITCPPDITLNCDVDPTDLGVTGTAVATSNCSNRDIIYTDIFSNLDNCNQGEIRRRWSVVDQPNIFCDQSILLENTNTLTPVINFSQVGDFTAVGCPDVISYGEPTWNNDPCESIGYTVKTDTFKFEDGACFKLVREYTVINWCDYAPNDPQWVETSDFTDGIIKHIQVVKVTDITKPVISNCEDEIFPVNKAESSCLSTIVLVNSALDEGSTNCPTGWLKWQVFVDLWSDGTDDYEFSSYLPTSDNNFNDTNANGIPDIYVTPTMNGDTIRITLDNIEGSMSNHKVRWSVSDGCNNSDACEYNFMVVDQKPPTPYCIDLSSALMESQGTLELWAIDFNLGSFDNCSVQDKLRYTFSETPPENDINYDEDQRSSSMIFDCDDVMNSPIFIDMYVWDEKGNSDHCIVLLSLIDNNFACGDGMRISGLIETEIGNKFDGASVTLNASLPEYPKNGTTNENGEYAFTNSPINSDFMIHASHDFHYLNGVSTLDLVKIQRHILGLESLGSPYKLIAADINADDNISSIDLNLLRKLILGVIDDIPTNESWKFVDADQELTMDLDLDMVNYSREIENLTSDMMNNDLIAVKIGDVTDNATSSLNHSQISQTRSDVNLEFSFEDNFIRMGEQIQVEFTCSNYKNILGFQMTINLEGLTYQSIESGSLEIGEDHLFMPNKNAISLSFNNSSPLSINEDDILFTLNFIPQKESRLKDLLSLSSKYLDAEAYLDIEDKIETVNISITPIQEDIIVLENKLHQNEPNPFSDNTLITFDLINAGPVVFSVSDATGNLLQEIKVNGVKGQNRFYLNSNDLNTQGVLIYQIQTKDFIAAKKMILIE